MPALDRGNLATMLRAAPAWFRSDWNTNFKRFTDRPLRVEFGDNISEPSTPTLVKSRPIGAKNCALLPFNYHRHWPWAAPGALKQYDCAWHAKSPTVVWRGATTGFSKTFDAQPRAHLATKWFGVRPDIDVAFSEIVQGQERYAAYLQTPPLTKKQQLRHAFIATPEGNDVASNLKWVLASNSVPVMPPPRYESWLLESQLKPMVHYLPVAPDFSDLGERLDWAAAHMAECHRMALAGQAYIAPFFQKEPEAALMDAVVRRFRG